MMDRWLGLIGTAAAIGSVAFAATMITRERAALPPDSGTQAIVGHDDRDALRGDSSAEIVDDDRTGSIFDVVVDDAAVARNRLVVARQDDRDRSDPIAAPKTGFVLRFADDRAALLQGPGGTIVVVPGALIPDAGRVLSIERRAGRWVVVTATGVIEEPPM